MKKDFLALAVASLILSATPAAAQVDCRAGGIPGLSAVASKLHVKPAPAPSLSALNDCSGRSYEIAALLSAVVARIEKAEADVIEAATFVRAMKTAAPQQSVVCDGMVIRPAPMPSFSNCVPVPLPKPDLRK